MINKIKNKKAFSILMFFLVLFISQLPAYADWEESYHYFLVMSKEDSLCQHMLSVYNEDLKTKGKLVLEEHPEYSAIEWDNEHQIMDGKYLYKPYDFRMSLFDINNDKKDELVVISKSWPFRNPEAVSSNLDYYPYYFYEKVKTGIKIEEFLKSRIGERVYSEKGSLHTLSLLPLQGETIINKDTSTEWVNEYGIMIGYFSHIFPFSYKNKSYISIFSLEPSYGKIRNDDINHTNIILIRQYQSDNRINDICYYIKSPVFEYQKNTYDVQGEKE